MELVVNFSGGKDSCAMLAFLVEKYPNIKKHVVFADTGWEHTDAESWSRSIVEGIFGLPLHVVRNPNKTFLTMAERRGKFAGMQTRQCTSDLKRGPIQKWIRQNVSDPVVISCMGIRSEESASRSKQKRLKRNSESNSKRTIWDWQPIKDWKETEVFSFLEERKIPLHPVYQYLKRFSCRVCIFMSDHDLRKVNEHDPKAIQIIAEIEKKIGFTMFQRGPIENLVNS